MKRSRKPYPDEFKQEAVRLLKERQLPRSQVARDLGIDPETLRRWARDLAPDSQLSQDSATTPPVSAAELARLRCENEQLRMERDILKKPSASSWTDLPNTISWRFGKRGSATKLDTVVRTGTRCIAHEHLDFGRLLRHAPYASLLQQALRPQGHYLE
jgi:transposase